MLIALTHGLIYAVGLPLWQAPDEPMLYEYAALTAELGRVPASIDHSPSLETRLVASMNRQDFWRHTLGTTPDPLPTTLEAAQRLFPMPRQVAGDPPIYFLLAALPLRLTAGWSVEAQVYLLRVLNVLLLPAGVLCVYLIAREAGAPDIAALAAAALVALQPMYIFVGSALSNDGPANLAAALLCLLIMRAIRRGLPGRGVALTLAMALLCLQIKRTTVPPALAAAALAAIWALRYAVSSRITHGRSRIIASGIALLLLLLGGTWFSSQIAWGQAARWYDAKTLSPLPRITSADGYVLSLSQGEEATQVLPDVATVYLRNGALSVGARIWSDGPAVVRLVLYTGPRYQETSFALSGVADAEMRAAVGSQATGVRLGIIAERGRLLVGNVWMRGVGLPGDLITNGNIEHPALRADSPLVPIMRYLRLEDLIWATESGRVRWGLATGEWFGWLFDSFWGHFGWMRIAVVRESAWEPAIGAICALGLLGAIVALIRLGRGRRAPLATLILLIGVALALLIVNALIDPYPIQQGRYLFPILPALAVAVTSGQAALLPARLRPIWLTAWLGFWACLSSAALFHLVAIYYW
jgi:hypothetical protein